MRSMIWLAQRVVTLSMPTIVVCSYDDIPLSLACVSLKVILLLSYVPLLIVPKKIRVVLHSKQIKLMTVL